MLTAPLDTHGIDRSTPGTPGRMVTTADALDGEVMTSVGSEVNLTHVQPMEVLQSELMKKVAEGESISVTFNMSGIRDRWIRSIKATRNEHFNGSKYNSQEFKGRSRVFKPKTRTALRKKMSNAANALFATGDVVAMTAVDEADDFQNASAALKQQVMNYRLSRNSRRNGIRWVQTAIGALHDAATLGVCISKQTWSFIEEIDPATGERHTVEDRPKIQLIEAENCLIDMNCDWTNPAQTSTFLILRHRMNADDVWNLVDGNRGIEWLDDVTEETIIALCSNSGPSDSQAVRASRDGGKDNATDTGGIFRPIWVYECFVRHKNVDYCFWTAGSTRILSRPLMTRHAYPAMRGERPIVFGVGSLEPHHVYPMSPVESWQQLQMEINDQTNLRLDHMKRAVTPPTKILRGKRVDINEVKRGGPNQTIMLDSMEDVMIENIPDLPQGAFVENNFLSSDFDSLAGVFDTSSVNQNKQLNETVGGMRLMAGSSDAVSEFDLSIFVETWVEPAIWQVLRLEEMYETDATVLAIAGERAKLWEKYGISEITDKLMEAETNVTVKIGVGSASMPEDKGRKFMMAAAAAMQVLTPMIQEGLIKAPVIKPREVINTIFGSFGFDDGGDRFFAFIPEDGEQPPPPQPPQDPKAQAAMMKAQADVAKVQLAGQKMQQDGRAGAGRPEAQAGPDHARRAKARRHQEPAGRYHHAGPARDGGADAGRRGRAHGRPAERADAQPDRDQESADRRRRTSAPASSTTSATSTPWHRVSD
jgi:hypothetical protein